MTIPSAQPDKINRPSGEEANDCTGPRSVCTTKFGALSDARSVRPCSELCDEDRAANPCRHKIISATRYVFFPLVRRFI
jgi:hypothetical protein